MLSRLKKIRALILSTALIQILFSILQLLTTKIINGYYGISTFGEYSTLIASVSFFSLFSVNAYRTILLRTPNKKFKKLSVVKLKSAGLVVMLVSVSFLLIKMCLGQDIMEVILPLSLVLLASGMNEILLSYLRSTEYSIISQFLVNVFRPLSFVLLLLLTLSDQLTYLVSILLISHIIVCVILFALLLKSTKIGMIWSSIGSDSALNKEYFMLTLSAIFKNGMNTLPILWLGFLGAFETAAVFKVLVQISGLTLFPLVIYNYVFVTRFALNWEKSMDSVRRDVKAYFRTILFVILLLILSVYMYGEFVLEFLSPMYTEYQHQLVFLVCIQSVNLFFGPVGLLLNVAKLDKYFLNGQVISFLGSAITILILRGNPLVASLGALSAGVLIWNVYSWILVRFKLNINTCSIL